MNALAKTVLFTDVVGSTEFASARGDEMAVTLLHVHEKIAREAAADNDGQVVKSTGDGFLLAFPTCIGGVAAALEIRDRLEQYNLTHADAALHVRMGLHAGPVVEEAGDFYGITVNVAARVAAKARSGQVLVSEAVRAEASSSTDWIFVDRGLFWLKGLREQWRLHEATSGKVTTQPLSLEGQTPFVDRDAERAALRRCVDHANDGRGALVLVAGNAGVGKTRLVEEIGTEAGARGLEFLVGRCHETSRGEPYTPFVEILEALQRRLPPDRFRELVGEDAGEIARLLPKLRRWYSDIPPSAELPSKEERRYLFVTVQEVLARLAAVRPVVILLDDLHWADEPSLLLVEHIAGALAELPIVVVATYTPDEVSTAGLLHAMLTKLHRRRLVETIGVGDLGESDVEILLAQIIGASPPHALVHALFEATAGNPFFVEEVVHQLAEQGRLLVDGRWHDADDLHLDVPESIRLIIQSRLEKVHPNTRQVLGTAALIGRDFGFELLDVLGELSEDELLDALDEAERARLITSAIDRSAVRFAFAHELIRQTLVNELSLTRRQRLHLRVADALEQVYQGDLAEHAAAIAYQLERAGQRADPDRTVRFLVMAAERALEAAAYAEALRHFEHALSMIPEDDAVRRVVVLEGMGTAERSLGHLDRALAHWRGALDVFERLGDLSSVARLCLDSAVQVAFWRGGSEVIELVDRGLRALSDRPSPQRSGLLALAGRIASQSGLYDRGEELLRQALTEARAHPDDRVLGLALYSRAAHHFAYNQFAQTTEAGLESIEYLRRAGDVWNLANVLGYVGTSLGWLGRFDAAAELGREGEALAQRLGNWSAYVFAEQSQSFREVGSRPAPAALERRGEHALELGNDMGFPWLSSIGHTRIGLAAFWRGRWDDALWQFEEAARLEVPGAAGGHLGRLFVIHAYLGNRATAIALLEQPRAELPVLGRANTGTSWGLAAAAVEALTILDEDEQAAELYDTIAELANTGSLMRSWDYRLVATLQGMAAACGRDWDRSEMHFEDALRIARDLPMRVEEPDACRFYARMLLARNRPGDRDRARDLLGRAAAGYAALEMSRHEELVRGLV